ncbi:MAG: hypothetical protein AAFZ65_15105 [Planctomycetota bacterium]
MIKPTLYAASAALLAPLAASNEVTITPLTLIGDNVAGVGLITSFSEVTVNSSGQWAVIANTDNPLFFENSVVLRDGQVEFVEGQILGDPKGNILKGLGPIGLDDVGRLTANFVTVPPFQFDVEVVMVNGKVIYSTDMVSPSGVSPASGFPLVAFADARTNAAGQLLTHLSVDDGQNFRSALLFTQLDAALNPALESYLAWETQLLPDGLGGLSPVESIVGGPNQIALGEGGQVGYLADLAAPANLEIGFYQPAGAVAVEGLDSPVPGRTWTDLAFAPIDVNSGGDTVVVGRISGDPATNLIVARNGEIIAQSGMPVPGVPGQTILNFSQTAPVFIDESGSVLWQGVWLEGGGLRKALFLDDEPLVLEGVTPVGNSFVQSFFGFQDSYELSADGSKLIFLATLDDGTEGIFLLSREGGIETLNGCSGNTGVLAVTGTPEPGGQLDVALSGGSASPSAATLWISTVPAIAGSPCGLPLPGIGELLIGLTGPLLTVDFGLFTGSTLSQSFPIASNPSLIGAELFLQGLFIAPGGNPELELTSAARVCFGS